MSLTGHRPRTPDPDPLQPNAQVRILVIDDEAAIRDSLKMTLEYEGYEFIGAATGQEGLALVEREAPDLVLLDVKMPGMDGLEVLDRLRAMNDALPVVVVSGHGTISTAVEATKKGAFDFIEKPFASERVLVSLSNALDQRGCATRTGRSRRPSRSAIRWSARARRSSRSWPRSAAPRRPTPPCSFRARAASARSSSRARFIATACAAASASSR